MISKEKKKKKKKKKKILKILKIKRRSVSAFFKKEGKKQRQ